MEQIELQAKKREEKGKTAAKRLRERGFVPAVVFGKAAQSLPLSIDTHSLDDILQHGAAHKILNLKIQSNGAGEARTCVIQEIQRDAFGKHVIHVDFHEISLNEKFTSRVPLKLEGTAPGVKEGGVVDHVLWDVEVRSLPLNMPEKLSIDISTLLINQSLHVKDIKALDGVEILEDPQEVVVVVHPPRVEEAPAAAAAAGVEGVVAAAPAAPAQPEVISKGKKEEEEVEEKPKK